MSDKINPGRLQEFRARLLTALTGFPDDSRGGLSADVGKEIDTVLDEFLAGNDPSKCANCGASMQIYRVRLDYHKGILLLAMAREVRDSLGVGALGRPFTEANKVHVPTLLISNTARCQTTQASKLGLIAKVRNSENGRQIPGYWLITRRGWAALRGDPVKAEVEVWRNEIRERSEEVMTLGQALSFRATTFRQAPDPMDASISDGYQANEWVEVAGLAPGNLF